MGRPGNERHTYAKSFRASRAQAGRSATGEKQTRSGRRRPGLPHAAARLARKPPCEHGRQPAPPGQTADWQFLHLPGDGRGAEHAHGLVVVAEERRAARRLLAARCTDFAVPQARCGQQGRRGPARRNQGHARGSRRALCQPRAGAGGIPAAVRAWRGLARTAREPAARCRRGHPCRGRQSRPGSLAPASFRAATGRSRAA
ncbi:hypothetical protein D3C81_1156280 [compost metagenome]